MTTKKGRTVTMDKLNIDTLIREYSFVVPEIQREYVWGSSANRQVLGEFLEDLNLKLSAGEVAGPRPSAGGNSHLKPSADEGHSLGFLYSYQSGNEQYLIDGQQRYTTLLLLLYFLSARRGAQELEALRQRYRIGTRLPAFSYRVRSLTEQFMADLLKSGKTTSKDIKDQKWFRSEYQGDTTIKAMLGALDLFEEKLGSCPAITVENLLYKVYFWYFDVDRTSQGEELYITMNSRGEKLTNSEQLKPRLLKNTGCDKERYGKLWDEWEEFFFKKELRSGRDIAVIDTAMDNLLRVVLELETCEEHNQLNPVEDAQRISLATVEEYFNALEKIYATGIESYCGQISLLYGDGDTDRNFYTLKALLVESMKGRTDYELRQVYETIRNQVRRNKLQNLKLLRFLKDYKDDEQSWYDFILSAGSDKGNQVITGHELEKVRICHQYGSETEEAIWAEQKLSFWGGEIKALTGWAKKDGEFRLDEFNHLCREFHLLFAPEKKGPDWTTDKVRQALLTRRMANYPYNTGNFGYEAAEWKEIMELNDQSFREFLDLFREASALTDEDAKKEKDRILDELIAGYPETEENQWAEFVQHDSLLSYCNTKRLWWHGSYGWLLVKNKWAKPLAVKNHLLAELIERKELLKTADSWVCWKWINWDSCVVVENKHINVVMDIRYLYGKDGQKERWNVKLFRRSTGEDEIKSALSSIAEDKGFVFDDDQKKYTKDIAFDDDAVLSLLQEVIASLTSRLPSALPDTNPNE